MHQKVACRIGASLRARTGHGKSNGKASLGSAAVDVDLCDSGLVVRLGVSAMGLRISG